MSMWGKTNSISIWRLKMTDSLHKKGWRVRSKAKIGLASTASLWLRAYFKPRDQPRRCNIIEVREKIIKMQGQVSKTETVLAHKVCRGVLHFKVNPDFLTYFQKLWIKILFQAIKILGISKIEYEFA